MEQLYLQVTFMSYLSSQLERFKKVGNYLFNFRCPYCGDSQKSRAKARGYLYRNSNGLLSFQCHNCGENHHFKNFLKYVSPSLYREYLLATFKSPTKEIEETKPEKSEVKGWQKLLTPVTELSKIHPAVVYLKERKIPKDKWGLFWYTANFRSFAEQMHLAEEVPADPRLLLVEADSFGNLKLVVARAINSSEMRYVTLKLDEAYPKLFGLSRIDYTKPVFIVEGAIDSLFLPNCIATLDANLSVYRHFNLGISPTLIWDNEPRSIQTVKRLKKAILENEKVVVFPDMKEKDINEMVLNGLDVESLINSNICSGALALLKFSKWNKTSKDVNYGKTANRKIDLTARRSESGEFVGRLLNKSRSAK